MLAPEKVSEIAQTCVGHGDLHIPSEFYRPKPAETFRVGSAVCVFGELLNAAKGDVLASKWYAESVAGYDPGALIGNSELVIEKDGSYDVRFQFQPPNGGWDPGTYRVKVYFDNALQTDHVFLMR